VEENVINCVKEVGRKVMDEVASSELSSAKKEMELLRPPLPRGMEEMMKKHELNSISY
jgi:hypothetical protein